jgi:hypothetical protein
LLQTGMPFPSDVTPSASQRRIGELDETPFLTSDGPADPASWWPTEHHHHEEDRHYAQMRAEHERALDEEHRRWRRERFARDFEDWRRTRGAGEPQGATGPRGAGVTGGDTRTPRDSGTADIVGD